MVLCMIALAGCASPPSTIRAASVSDDPYKAMDCDALLKERVLTTHYLPCLLTSRRRRSATRLPPRRSGSQPLFYVLLTQETAGAGEIARLKGEHDALNRVIGQKSCAT